VPELTLTEVASGINVPVDITHPPNDPRLFVITLTGDVRIIKDGALVDAPFLSLGDKVVVGGAGGDERGLLGIAFHPAYATNGLFYLHYSAGTGVPGANTSDTVIEEYKVSSDPDVADAASARVVLTVAQPDNGNAAFQNHKGGSINFGPDGLLYIGLGDGGGSGDDHGASGSGFAQDTSRLLGKILRIDPTGGDPYSTPADNLVQDVSGAAPEVWDYGLRNPFRRTFDACTGDMYIGDVGQNAYEEITIEKAGEGHKNYGWNIWEALHCYTGNSCDDQGITQPFVELERAQAQSITGGSVYRGSSIPALRGAYFYADYAANNAWYLFYDRNANSISTPVSVTQELNVNNLVAIQNGNDGELYFVALMTQGEISGSNRGEGAIYKLTAAE
jgi:glucose/arabinose dehydrogenase